jgi:poly[(R)-3-hydroxyalkanoate] polymerase subunit PhaC
VPRARYLVIVTQKRPELYSLLTRLFAADSAVEVVIDRRNRQRQSTAREAGRSTERRRQGRVDDQLHSLGAAVVRASPPEAPAATPMAPSLLERDSEARSAVTARWGEVVLLGYARDRPKRYTIPVLIVAPLTLRPEIFDLAPGLSLVEYLTAEGLEVFVLDFGSPDPVHRPGFEDYLDHLGSALDRTLALSGAGTATLLGYGIGGLFAVLYAALQPLKVGNLVTLATPVDFSSGPLYRLTQAVDTASLPGAVGNVPGDWIRDQIVWWICTMPEHACRLWLEISTHLFDPAYWRRHALIVQWLHDVRPFSGTAYRQFIRDFIQANGFAKREIRIGERLIDPTQITCPVLVAAHTEDLLVPPACAMALLGLVGSKDMEAFSVAGGSNGHVDILVGPEAQAVTWPKLTAWLAARSG